MIYIRFVRCTSMRRWETKYRQAEAMPIKSINNQKWPFFLSLYNSHSLIRNPFHFFFSIQNSIKHRYLLCVVECKLLVKWWKWMESFTCDSFPFFSNWKYFFPTRMCVCCEDDGHMNIQNALDIARIVRTFLAFFNDVHLNGHHFDFMVATADDRQCMCVCVLPFGSMA